MVMVIYHYIERIEELSIPQIFRIIYTIMKKYYPGEPVNRHMKSLINTIQDRNRVITTKNGKVKLPLLCSNGERVIPIYGHYLPKWELRVRE